MTSPSYRIDSASENENQHHFITAIYAYFTRTLASYERSSHHVKPRI